MNFGGLEIGEVFQTTAARYVKIADYEAMVIMEGMFSLSHKNKFREEDRVVPLYTRCLDPQKTKD